MSDSKIKLIDLASDPEQYSQGEATSWISDDSRQKVQQDRSWSAIDPIIPSSCHSVLDIGCGSGWLAARLDNRGVERYAGIEPSSKNFKLARKEHPHLSISQITLESYESDVKFDCILAIMLLSHIKDIKASFTKIYGMLNDNGIFISILSAFHGEQDRLTRNGRSYEVEVIDEDQYVDRSINGTGYGIADINRRPEYYMRVADSAGFRLIKQAKIEDSGYSPKDLLVFEKSAR